MSKIVLYFRKMSAISGIFFHIYTKNDISLFSKYYFTYFRLKHAQNVHTSHTIIYETKGGVPYAAFLL